MNGQNPSDISIWYWLLMLVVIAALVSMLWQLIPMLWRPLDKSGKVLPEFGRKKEKK